jgi:hypothetical protein
LNGKDRKFARSRKLEAGSFSEADVSVFFHFQARFPHSLFNFFANAQSSKKLKELKQCSNRG